MIELRTSGSHGLLERRNHERERIFDSGALDIARHWTRFQAWPSGMHTPWARLSARMGQLPRSISCPEELDTVHQRVISIGP